jgi:predicted nucleotidyltransferase
MLRDEILAILKASLPELHASFGVVDLALFGSSARNEAGPGSDVDILVAFEPGMPGGYFQFFALQEDLQERLKTRVDLVTIEALKRQLRDKILAEAIHAA